MSKLLMGIGICCFLAGTAALVGQQPHEVRSILMVGSFGLLPGPFTQYLRIKADLRKQQVKEVNQEKIS